MTLAKEEIEQLLDGVVIGIRFDKTFTVADNLGAIVDELLYSKGTYFSPDFFPVIEQSQDEWILTDNKSRYLRVGPTDIILEVNKLKGNKDITKDILEESFFNQVIKGVLRNYRVRTVSRLGHIVKYKLENSAILRGITSRLSLDVNNINLSFQKNVPTPDFLMKKDVKDYCSVIYGIRKNAKDDILRVFNDYQLYFIPAIESVNDVPFEKFLEARTAFSEGEFLTFLNRYLEKV